jgi:hypothetical protein
VFYPARPVRPRKKKREKGRKKREEGRRKELLPNNEPDRAKTAPLRSIS